MASSLNRKYLMEAMYWRMHAQWWTIKEEEEEEVEKRGGNDVKR